MSTQQANSKTGNGLLSVEQARARIMALVAPLATLERLHVRAALGRVLAENIISSVNVPPYANSAMDGYALRCADIAIVPARLRVIGTALAGIPCTGRVEPGTCVRIMTGAVLPDGADTVLMQEQVQRSGDDITVQEKHKSGENVRHSGEDIAIGSVVLPAGRRLLPSDLGLIASLGVGEVSVYRRLRVAFFSTGDELRSIGEPLAEGQIYDSNRYTLYGMLTRLGADLIDMGVIPDQRARIEAAFQEAAQAADVVITSGGVSVGEADYVKETLDRLGNVDFWKIAMKPGKPLAFGKVQQALFFGLPGNPVSVMATFYQFVLPALRHLMGEPATALLTIKVPCAQALKKQPGRTDFQRGLLVRNTDGELVVDSTGLQGSHVLSSMSRANCFIVLPAECGNVPAGTLVEVQPFEGLI
jgi:molybdopterin molybdotransferase